MIFGILGNLGSFGMSRVLPVWHCSCSTTTRAWAVYEPSVPRDTETVMMRFRQVLQCASAAALLAVTAAVPAQAQVRQVSSGNNAIGFNVGFFSVKGFDSRVDDDVLVADLSQGEF